MYRADFPFFQAHPDITYLDSAATTHKPEAVIERVARYYREECAPVGRSLYAAGVAATQAVEQVRRQTAAFLDAPDGHIVFTAGVTDALNLLAQGVPLQSGDEIIVSESEHHANIVPWQQLTARGVRVIFMGSHENGQVNLEQLGEALSDRTRVVALSLISNVFGTVLPVGEVRALLERQGSRPWFILDASQAAAHVPLSVRTLGCDALVFSAHKAYGPGGLGLLWGSTPLLESLTPLRTGGAMVDKVTLPESWFTGLPGRLEAGSPNTEAILGWGAALEYLQMIGMDKVAGHTGQVGEALRVAVTSIPGLHQVGEPDPVSGIVSVMHDSIHPHDLAQFLADKGICVRAGHQCAQPLHAARNLTGSLRASTGLYNTPEDAEHFGSALREAVTFFGHA